MHKSRIAALCAIVLMVVFAACGGGGGETTATETAEMAPPAAPAGSGAINGSINYSNGDHDVEIDMGADPVCLTLHTDPVETEEIVAADGKLANVFVYVKEGMTGNYSPPTEAAVLDQKGCKYSPHVSGVMTGQTLTIQNSDQTLHNVHALPKNNDEFNQGQPFEGMTLDKKFDTAEVMVRFKCDVHPWMGAYVGVVDHPFFAVSGADGSFSIGGLPAGDYVIEAWHEKLGTQTQNVSVSDGAVEVSFDFAEAAG